MALLRQVYLRGYTFRALNGPGIFTVRTPHERTHQQHLPCMHELACMNRAWYLFLVLLLISGTLEYTVRAAGYRLYTDYTYTAMYVY
jgi:hypothetical protein